MTTTITYDDVVDAINAGHLDGKLTDLRHAVERRLDTTRRTRAVSDFPIGTRVRFNHMCGTKYLQGEHATVISMARTKLVVLLDRPVGRFVRVENGISKPIEVRVPTSIIDIVE